MCRACAVVVQGVCRMCAGCVQGLSEDQAIHWVITTINKGQRFRLTRTDKRLSACTRSFLEARRQGQNPSSRRGISPTERA